VVSHTVTPNGAKIAARAGVDVIDHGVGDLPADAKLIALLKQHGNHYGFMLSTDEPKNLADPPPSLTGILDTPTLETGPASPGGPSLVAETRALEARRERFNVFAANAAAA